MLKRHWRRVLQVELLGAAVLLLATAAAATAQRPSSTQLSKRGTTRPEKYGAQDQPACHEDIKAAVSILLDVARAVSVCTPCNLVLKLGYQLGFYSRVLFRLPFLPPHSSPPHAPTTTSSTQAKMAGSVSVGTAPSNSSWQTAGF